MLDQEFLIQLAANSATIEPANEWPVHSLKLCKEAGVFSILSPGTSLPVIGDPTAHNSADNHEDPHSPTKDLKSIEAYIAIARNCLVTAFILTQRQAAVVRIAASTNEIAKERWLPKLFSGETFATVGISHLTTSRQHLTKPVLTASLIENGSQIELDGYSPWVTGAAHADVLVLGATLSDGRQILIAVDSKSPGVVPGKGMRLSGLNASKTDQVQLDHVVIDSSNLLFGPSENVMRFGRGGGTGSLQTSALAIGLSLRAVDFLTSESVGRADLRQPVEHLVQETQALLQDLRQVAIQSKKIDPTVNSEQIRQRANSLVLRTTQSTMMVAKGAGYMSGHPAERWCRESLFFLVWSCPKSVTNANLCEFASH